MKFTEIQWKEDSVHEDSDSEEEEEAPDYKSLSCPICGKTWLNVSEGLGEFNENECDHLMFRWYKDGAPEEIHIEQQDLEKAFREALLKVDNTIKVTDSNSVRSEVNSRRTDEEFWQAFHCPGVDEIIYGLNDIGTDIFGLRRDKPAD